MRYSKDQVEQQIKRYLNTTSLEERLKAHQELVKMQRNDRDVQSHVNKFAESLPSNDGDIQLKDCVMRLTMPAPTRQNQPVQDWRQRATDSFRYVFDIDPTMPDQTMTQLQDDMQKMVKDGKVKGNQFIMKMPDFTEEIQQKTMYKIMLGATCNELGATILATRTGELMITLGDTGGDLDVTLSQRNAESLKDTLSGRVSNTFGSMSIPSPGFVDSLTQKKSDLEAEQRKYDDPNTPHIETGPSVTPFKTKPDPTDPT